MKLGTRRLETWVRSLAVLAAMGAVLVAVGWLLGGSTGALFALAAAALSAWLSPQVTPDRLLAAQGARPLHPLEAPGLHEAVRALARRARLGAPPLYLVPAPVPQAFATSGEGRSAIGVTPALLQLLTPREVLAVLAHEVSHLRHQDLWMMRVAGVVQSLTRTMAFFGLLLLFVSIPWMLATGASFPALAALLLLVAPWAVNLLSLSLSRSRELDADLGAVALTNDPRALASALTTLERANRGPWWMAMLRAELPAYLLTHPRTEERVRRLLELAGRPEAIPAYRPPPRRVVIPEWRRPTPSW